MPTDGCQWALFFYPSLLFLAQVLAPEEKLRPDLGFNYTKLTTKQPLTSTGLATLNYMRKTCSKQSRNAVFNIKAIF